MCEWHLLESCRLQRAWLQAVLTATFFKWSIKEAKSLAPTLRQKLSQWLVENNFNADSCPWSALFSDDHIVLHYLGRVPPNTTSSLHPRSSLLFDFNVTMAQAKIRQGTVQWNSSRIHSSAHLSSYLHGSLQHTFGSWEQGSAISGWAESDGWLVLQAGSLVTGSLPTETQPAYLLSQGASNFHRLSWFFPALWQAALPSWDETPIGKALHQLVYPRE